jgi:hypothetical protein
MGEIKVIIGSYVTERLNRGESKCPGSYFLLPGPLKDIREKVYFNALLRAAVAKYGDVVVEVVGCWV